MRAQHHSRKFLSYIVAQTPSVGGGFGLMCITSPSLKVVPSLVSEAEIALDEAVQGLKGPHGGAPKTVLQ